MEQSQYNQLFSFIWNIATDVLVFAFDKGEYKKIIMPMMVLRRIDVLLEPTKQLQLHFWQQLSECIKSNDSYAKEFTPRKAQPQHWYDLSVGSFPIILV